MHLVHVSLLTRNGLPLQSSFVRLRNISSGELFFEAHIPVNLVSIVLITDKNIKHIKLASRVYHGMINTWSVNVDTEVTTSWCMQGNG